MFISATSTFGQLFFEHTRSCRYHPFLLGSHCIFRFPHVLQIVLPFNAASSQDVDSLVQYITLPKSHASGGLGLGVPSFVIPFAAIPVEGRDIGMIDGRAELAQRYAMFSIFFFFLIFRVTIPLLLKFGNLGTIV